jgi:hypothetical protein
MWINELEGSPKRKKVRLLRTNKWEINNIGNADENKYKKSLQQFLPLSEVEIQGHLHPAQAKLGYFLAWFQSFQLSSTQSESPLASKYHVYSTVNGICHISTRINRNRINKSLLYYYYYYYYVHKSVDSWTQCDGLALHVLVAGNTNSGR